MAPESEKKDNPLLESLTKIASVYMDRNTLQPEQVPPLLDGILKVLVRVPGAGIDDRVAASVATAPSEAAQQEPATPAQSGPRQAAVPIEQSITPEHIVCLEDGARVVLLKRHLSAKYNMTPREYRDRWGLPSDYPMVAPTYSKRRSAAAKAIGLGQRRVTEAPVKATPAAPEVVEPVPVAASVEISSPESTARRRRGRKAEAAPATPQGAEPAPVAEISSTETNTRRPRARKAAAAASSAPETVTGGGRRSRVTRDKDAVAPKEAPAAITAEAPGSAPAPEKKARGRAKLDAAATSKPRARKVKATA